MTVEIYFIEGRRGSACNNNAFSAVSYSEGNTPVLLDIIPAEDLSAAQRDGLKAAFENALRKTNDVEKARTLARQTLGLDRGHRTCRPA